MQLSKLIDIVKRDIFRNFQVFLFNKNQVFDFISSNIDEVLSIILSTIVFVFGYFNVHHKDWPTFSGGTDRPGELCYNDLKWPYSNC